MTKDKALTEYMLRLGDSSLILGHRLSEWCGHGPILEEDIALINVSLDLIGQSRILFDHAGKLEGKDRGEDDFAYWRKENEFRNLIITEQPNGHYGDTIIRQFLFDVYHFYLYTELLNSTDQNLKIMAEKFIKEITYHLKHSSEWVIRLGDGTEESHKKIQESLNDFWMYTGEMFEMDEVDALLIKEGIAPDLNDIKAKWEAKVNDILSIATLTKPESTWSQSGSRKGIHSEHLGYILTEMQFLPHLYPDAKW